jgi:hypothetical protein
MSEFEELSEDGLLEDLRKTEAELEDLEEVRRFTLGQNSPSSGPYHADQPSFFIAPVSAGCAVSGSLD